MAEEAERRPEKRIEKLIAEKISEAQAKALEVRVYLEGAIESLKVLAEDLRFLIDVRAFPPKALANIEAAHGIALAAKGLINRLGAMLYGKRWKGMAKMIKERPEKRPEKVE